MKDSKEFIIINFLTLLAILLLNIYIITYIKFSSNIINILIYIISLILLIINIYRVIIVIKTDKICEIKIYIILSTILFISLLILTPEFLSPILYNDTKNIFKYNISKNETIYLDIDISDYYNLYSEKYLYNNKLIEHKNIKYFTFYGENKNKKQEIINEIKYYIINCNNFKCVKEKMIEINNKYNLEKIEY